MRCTICPRHCSDVLPRHGFCGAGDGVRVAKTMLHMWEEPCLSGSRGSGTLFFSGCALKCVFCQNHAISQSPAGDIMTGETFLEACRTLRDQGAHNINLVNPSHFSDVLAEWLTHPFFREVPVVWNSHGYESAETLRKLDGLVDIYLPDLKFFSPEMSRRYAGCPDYFQVASDAVREMVRQTGPVEMDARGMMLRGTMIRHLVLPGGSRDSVQILAWMAQTLPETVWVSLMSQYTPEHRAEQYPEINRRLTAFELRRVEDALMAHGLTRGYQQSREAASNRYIPDFSEKNNF